ncbi:MAG: DNA methyltransferase [Mesorhizobium sp.]|nr:MAG: DNA methyltransferase [Mesorhizobium sp.]
MRLLAYGGLANWPFESLDPQSYDFIMADPPWEFSLFSAKGENKSAQRHYRCLPLDEIKAFPVQDLASENCVLWLWATGAMLRKQFDVLDAWGFEYKTQGVWNKVTASGKPCFGTGYILRSSHEPFLIATRGKPKTKKNVRSSFNGVRRLHSEKPDEAFGEAERLMPKARRVELFSRTNRAGWESWGDQVGTIVREAA